MTRRRKLGKKTNATKLAHKKFRWLKQLALDPDLPLLSLRACILINDRANLDHGGGTIVGQDTLARELGVERETLNRALRAAVALGHLESIRRGRDKPNAYRMVLKDEVRAADVVGKSPTSEAHYDVTEIRHIIPV
jgi:hypothetical protein